MTQLLDPTSYIRAQLSSFQGTRDPAVLNELACILDRAPDVLRFARLLPRTWWDELAGALTSDRPGNATVVKLMRARHRVLELHDMWVDEGTMQGFVYALNHVLHDAVEDQTGQRADQLGAHAWQRWNAANPEKAQAHKHRMSDLPREGFRT